MNEYTFTTNQLLIEAKGLLSEQGENTEYDRAIVELVTRLLPGVNHDDHDTVLARIKGADEYTAEDDEPTTYRIVRYHFNGRNRTVRTGLTLAEAQAHCNDDATSGDGWFDGYVSE